LTVDVLRRSPIKFRNIGGNFASYFGGEIQRIGVVQDVTERKQAEQQSLTKASLIDVWLKTMI
jgi:hypothetical protein